MTINSLTEHYEYLEAYSFFNTTLNTADVPTSSIPDDFFSTHFLNKIDNISVFIKNCNKLNDYITRSVSKKCHDNNTCLEIINYWLNCEVRSDSDEKNNSLFNSYKEFMQKYKNLDSYNSKIYYINNELFNKKKVLYELYDEYDNLFNLLEPFDYSKCVHLATIVNNYNNIITQYPQQGKTNFSQVLTLFKSNLESKADDYIKKCDHRIPKFHSFVDKSLNAVSVTENSQQTSEYFDDFHSPQSENLGSTFSITFFGTSVGVFLTLMLFHKMTLFGYRLRNKKNNKIIMPDNLGEETYELPVYTLEEHENNSRHSTYNLTYQSVEN
ncbi:PIR Superfamily Protein [Plasmodium ovale wallikeri]|uniref:PIR Superfamily Protein n=2 Tax=Plasmodium ovale TaxID=36330 RepID=A0A1A9A5X2_PLAOA|nr:PIR Superfamily Protein [Plasmodium ovale wallikeri]SBT54105.1 PIR Superfamily Protein [Plasmodium ovale wallikeri]SBT74445.1 PIR protein [Plasmodium ovale]